MLTEKQKEADARSVFGEHYDHIVELLDRGGVSPGVTKDADPFAWLWAKPTKRTTKSLADDVMKQLRGL